MASAARWKSSAIGSRSGEWNACETGSRARPHALAAEHVLDPLQGPPVAAQHQVPGAVDRGDRHQGFVSGQPGHPAGVPGGTGAAPDRQHGAGLRLLDHQPAALGDQHERVLLGHRSRDGRGGELAHAVPQDRIGTDAVPCEHAHQTELDGEQRGGRDVRAAELVRPARVEQAVQERIRHHTVQQRVSPFDPLPELGVGGVCARRHAGVLASLTGEGEDRTALAFGGHARRTAGRGALRVPEQGRSGFRVIGDDGEAVLEPLPAVDERVRRVAQAGAPPVFQKVRETGRGVRQGCPAPRGERKDEGRFNPVLYSH